MSMNSNTKNGNPSWRDVVSGASIYRVGCDRVSFLKDNKWGVVDMVGNIIVPLGKYDYIDGFDHNVARVKYNGRHSLSNPGNNTEDRWGIISIYGTEVVPVEFSEVWGWYGKKLTYTRLCKIYEDFYNNKVRDEYIFILPCHSYIRGKLDGPGIWEGRSFRTYEEINIANIESNYSVWDALEGEEEAAGNIDYEW